MNIFLLASLLGVLAIPLVAIFCWHHHSLSYPVRLSICIQAAVMLVCLACIYATGLFGETVILDP